MKLTKNWKEEIKEYFGIHYIEPSMVPLKTLWCSRCSREKSNKKTGKPNELYVGRVTARFCRWAESQNQLYGILSDKYGIVMNDEIIESYDTHPNELTDEDKVRLGKIIRQKVQGEEFDKIVFYNASPLMSRPYFKMLAASGLEIYYVTKLPQSGALLF